MGADPFNDPGLQYDIIERTGQAEYYLREARRAGLPLPGYVTISAHDFGTWRSSDIGIQLASLDEVSQWAQHFGTAIEGSRTRVVLEKTGHHDVVAYCGAGEVIEVPGLAEHTEAAPKIEPHDEGTSHCTSQPEHIHIYPSPEMQAAVSAALGEHTEAACDTITKAAQ